MQLAYLLGGGTPVIKSYQIGTASVTNVGVPLLIDTAGEGGLNLGGAAGSADFVGMAVDTATYSATQGTGANSAESKVRVIINPDACWRGILSGGSTEGTALTLKPVTTAHAGGLNVITGDDFSNDDDGSIWAYDGTNVSQVRKITVGDATDASVIVPFDNAITVGDNYISSPFWPNSIINVNLTSNALFQVDATVAGGTGADFTVVDMDLRDISKEGRTKSSIDFYANDHIYSGSPT